MLLDAVYTWEFNILLKLLDDKFTNEIYFIISKIITSRVVLKFISLADEVTITEKLLATVGKFLIYVFSNTCFGRDFERYFCYFMLAIRLNLELYVGTLISYSFVMIAKGNLDILYIAKYIKYTIIIKVV